MLIKFECNNPECDNNISKFFKSAADIPPFLDCGGCGVGKLERILGAPTSNSTQIIDNGVQPRQVELMNAVVEKEQERLREGN